MPLHMIPMGERDNSPTSLGARIREIRLRTHPTKAELRARSRKLRKTGPKFADDTSQGLTQEELAKRAECSLPVIGHVEGNKIRASADLVRRIAKALDIPVEEFQTTCSHCGQILVTLPETTKTE